MTRRTLLALVTLILVSGTLALAQFPEDALRFSAPGLGVGARSLGMGNASTATAGDFSASYSNPAGLATLTMNELSVGLSHIGYEDNSTYFGNGQSFTNNATNLNSLGLAYVVPTVRGSLVLGLGYGRSADYTTGLSFKGFNPVSSIIQEWAPDGQPYPADITRAEALELAQVDTNSGTFVSPITNNLTQSGTLLEGGGMNYISLSGATEAAQNFYIGLSLDFISGSYSYNRTYREQDLANNYNTFPFDFASLEVRDIIESDLSGITAKLGMLYKFGERGRFGFALKTPSWITVRETYASDATSVFDNGDTRNDPAGGDNGTRNEYDITTPFVLSAGAAYIVQGLTLSGDLEYTDWTEMEFRNGGSRLLAMNTDIKQIFRQTLNLRGGAEYQLPSADVRLRAGYMFLPSPYKGDNSDFAQKYLTAGVGITLDPTIIIDVAYARGTWDTFRQIYSGAYTDKESVTTNNIVSTVTFRF
jgi:long-subunit fatty acid transport protein